MEKTTDTPQQRSDLFSLKEDSPIKQSDLYHSETRYNIITISGYDSVTNRDSIGCTFEENIEKCLKPPTYIKIVDPKNRTGDILFEKVVNLANIQAVDISKCGLTEIPPVLFSMHQLKVLHLSDNHIHFLPDDWGHLDLTALDISHNVLSEINSSIKCQKNLEVLVMKNCNLKDFPSHVLQLSKLRCLVLDNNPLGKLEFDALRSSSLQSISLMSCLIPEFCEFWLPNMQDINVGFNSIQHFPANLSRDVTVLKLLGNPLGTIPEELSLLGNLTELNISFCELKDFPLPILKLRKLVNLDISSNFIHHIPEEITKLQLEMLHFGRNPLDEFPKFLGQFPALKNTDLSSCFLERIPPVICELKNLTEMSLCDNCITELPEYMCQLNLEKLNLADNPLDQLPESFANLVNLKNLDLSSVNLEEIPSQILDLSKVERLDVKNNALENLPESWKKCINIKHFDLSENILCTLPESISQLQVLQELNLKSCCLSEFPKVLLHLNSLQSLNMEENLISELPDNFQSLNVESLNLRSNLLSNLPDSLSSQSKLKNIDLSSNRLTKFPPVILMMHNIKNIILDDNYIPALPQKWEGLHIVKLSLSRNPLVKIDNSPLHELKCMVSLSLKSCLLHKIPTYFSSFSEMSRLDLSDNNLRENAINALPPNLTWLVLDNNPLTTVPVSVQKAVKLHFLSLSSCGLTKLPTHIGLLELEHLDVFSNSLTYLPSGLENTILSTIYLSWNPLTSLDVLNNLRRLRVVCAYGCALQVFPRQILNLRKLTKLDLSWNNFRSIPGDLHHDNLKTLSFQYIKIKTLPNAITDLTNLHTLEVGDKGEFSSGVLSMLHLLKLKVEVDYNSLLVLPTSWRDLGKLENLSCMNAINLVSISSLGRLVDLKINSCKEAMPAAIQNKFLKKLYISAHFSNKGNSLPEIQSTLLQSLSSLHHKLPYLPEPLISFKRLRELCISHSYLKVFPQDLCKNLKKLEVLDIGNNSLRTLPEVWCCRRLKDLNLTKAPTERLSLVLQQLPCLTKLNVSECRLFTFPPALLQLEKLTDLNISNNHITELPPEWNNTCLKHLKIADNDLGQGSSFGVIAKLSSLETLNVSGNNLTNVPVSVRCLQFLRNLDISNNPVKEFPASMEKIQTLEIFKGSACELNEFPSFLLQLRKIKDIELEKNKIKTLPEGHSLPCLKKLKLSNNKGLKLSTNTLLGVESLECLSLASCGLTELPEFILRIPVFHALNLEDNFITRIPEAMYTAIKRIFDVRINTNILLEPPKEIYEGNMESANQYYTDLKISKACKVGFHNVILLGSTTAGKTSLIQSLIKGESTLTKFEERTIAADEETWELMENLHFHIIDFGGHDVYELAYPIFLKDRKGSIIIVIDLSKLSPESVEKNLFKWLHTVLSITGDSTNIIAVGTKTDLCDDVPRKMKFLRKSIDEWIEQMLDHADRLLNSEVSSESKTQIAHFKDMATQEVRTLATSSLSMAGLEKLKKILLEHSRENIAKLPSSWHEMYESLARLKAQRHSEGFYKVAQLQRICNQPITPGGLHTCLWYMHQRGMVLWYGNDSTLKDYVFYDITFIISTLKELLVHDMESTFKTKMLKPYTYSIKEPRKAIEKLRETGMASENLLKFIWQNVAGTDETFSVALRILKMFLLCYEADSSLLESPAIPKQVHRHSKERVIYFPWFVSKATGIELEQIWPQHVPPHIIPLKCIFTFEYSIPTSLFEQFSVQLQSLLAKGHSRKDWKDKIYVKQDAVKLLVTRDSDRNIARLVIELRAKLENICQMYKLCVSVVKNIQILRKVFPGIL